ncbi:hypothetical protein, partial [Escherichia coli]|uniref:hypothetical protein n=1 Tax=Escherichia coli TaxID=562 RepID=UPI001BC8A9B9
IRGLAHSAGESVVVVLAPLRRGHFFAIRFSLLQVRKRLHNGVDHDDLQCDFTGILRWSSPQSFTIWKMK